ncbi:MAG: ABC transporter permease [Actinomycetes bacterium]|nr:ABC transporter permease [Actinomycetes bacterium]
MNLFDIFAETLRSLSANKARSALTILGIVVGIGSVIGLISIGQGAKTSIEGQIRSIGTNLVTITNTATSGEGLTDGDLEALTQLPNVTAVEAVRSGSFVVVSGEKGITSQVMGVTPSYEDIRNIDMGAGRFITAYQEQLGAHAAVVSPGLVTSLWGEGTPDSDVLNNSIRIGGVVFTIVGVTGSGGGGAIQSLTSDVTVYVPQSAAASALTGKGSYSSVLVVGQSEGVMDALSEQSETLLKSRHGYDPNKDDSDFSVMNMSGLLDMADTITGMLTTLLAAIASISLVVGGIGIMNMMLTTVTERTREIGLRKAIGATPGNVTTQFLVESVVLTSLGGLIGVALGIALAAVVNATGLLTTTVTLGPILLAVGVCMLIGIVFGWWPARRAAKLDPIEALRYQ